MMMRLLVLFLVCAVQAVPVPENSLIPVRDGAAVSSASMESNDPLQKPENVSVPTSPKVAPVQDIRLPTITVAIPSMRRWTHEKEPAPEHYLKPLVTSLWADMSDTERRHVNFVLMNVDKQPENHAELHEVVTAVPNITVITKQRSEQIDLGMYLPVNEQGLYDDPQGRQVTRDTLNWRAGETMDAPRLWLSASVHSDYVLFLEDDVTPTSHAISKVYKIIRDMELAGKGDFLMIDLYTPAISWGPATASNMELYPFECCTQAMLFKSSHVSELCAYEFDHPDSPVDDNIRDFVRADPSHRQVYAMMPNPFEHVGRYSSNPEKSFGTIEHRSLNFEP